MLCINILVFDWSTFSLSGLKRSFEMGWVSQLIKNTQTMYLTKLCGKIPLNKSSERFSFHDHGIECFDSLAEVPNSGTVVATFKL